MALVSGAILTSMNYLIPGCIGITRCHDIKNPLIQKTMDTEYFSHKYNGRDQDVALKYLKLAHAITSRHMSFKWTDDNDSDSSVLESGFGDCFNYSKYTHSNYLFLLDMANREDLSDYVRFSSGELHKEDGRCSHAWLGFRDNKKWIPYETTMDLVPEYFDIDPGSIDNLIPTRDVLKFNDDRYVLEGGVHYNENGFMIPHIDIVGCFRNSGSASIIWKGIMREMKNN